MKLLIVLFLLCLLPSIYSQCSTKTVFPLIYGRKEIQENVVLYDMKNNFEGGGYLLGGGYYESSTNTQKAFFMHAREFGEAEFKYIYSAREIDRVNKVAFGNSYKFGAGKSEGTGDDTFFILKARDQYSPIEVRQIASDINSVDDHSQIGKFR